jgi:hypothetical protein
MIVIAVVVVSVAIGAVSLLHSGSDRRAEIAQPATHSFDWKLGCSSYIGRHRRWGGEYGRQGRYASRGQTQRPLQCS